MKSQVNVNPNAPSAPPGTEPMYYDKYGAAEYTGLSPDTIFYHHYKSGNLKGGVKHFGRVVWTQPQLDEFMRTNPERGAVAAHFMTVSAYVRDEVSRSLTTDPTEYRYKGQRIVKVERDFNDTRRYYITTADNFEHAVWNNSRVEMVTLRSH